MLKVALIFLSLALVAQCSPSGSVRGRVVDPSGAVVPGASVMLGVASRRIQTVTAAADGSYSFEALGPGAYWLQASAPDLVLRAPVQVEVGGQAITQDLHLEVAASEQRITVESNSGPALSTANSNNANALILSGDKLQTLGDDPEDLAADLRALAGPSAGPDGTTIYIDGFSGGQLPSKDSIREIHINQNPFAPEFDHVGIGRVEILTKPGSDKLHGSAFYNFGNDFWDSRDPYAAQKAPYHLNEFGGNVGGPLGSVASFFLDVQHTSLNNGLIVNAITLNPQTLAIIDPYTAIFPMPESRTIVSPRLDLQLSANNTLSLRYQWTQADMRNAGAGGLDLPSRAYHSSDLAQTFQAAETAILGTHALNQLTFQFFRPDLSTIANDPSPALLVLGAFQGGGAQTGKSSNRQTDYQLHNTTTINHGAHTLRFGVWGHGLLETDIAMQNFGGTFTFTSLDQYRQVLAGTGAAPAQFTMVSGNPVLSAAEADGALFAGDEWRARPNLTVSYGFRYEAQTTLHDWGDIAPRFGLSWAPFAKTGKSAPRTVVRFGFGTFYDRFPIEDMLIAVRYNGINQQQYTIANPDFFPYIPAPAALAAMQSPQTIYRLDPALRAPYMMLGALALERQLMPGTTLTAMYAVSRELHQWHSADINAPLPGTYDPKVSGSGVFPLGNPDPVFQMESSGLFKEQQFSVTLNTQATPRLSVFAVYVLQSSRTNTDGINTFPANPYSGAGEFGPSAVVIPQGGNAGITFTSWRGIRSVLMISGRAGLPFNITTGTDLYGDSLFNARPGVASSPNQPGVIATSYGLLDPNPSPGEPVLQRNAGQTPPVFYVNLRIGKLFSFGGTSERAAPAAGPASNGTIFGASAQSAGPASPGRRYNLSITLDARNVLNRNNPGEVVGDLSSPLFGQPIQSLGAAWQGGTTLLKSANNRRLELQTRFTF